MTPRTTREAFTANRAAITAASRYDTAKAACAFLSDDDRVAMMIHLLDQIDIDAPDLVTELESGLSDLSAQLEAEGERETAAYESQRRGDYMTMQMGADA